MPDTDNIHIKKFAKVDNFYYRGGHPDESDLITLAALGVKTIINLREPYIKSGMMKHRALAAALGMKYYNIPLIQPIPPNEDQINLFFSILSDPNNLPVYVHCNSGEDRTGIMTALYRIRCYRWSFKQAYSEMKYYGYHRVLFPSQKYFLRKYAENLGTG